MSIQPLCYRKKRAFIVAIRKKKRCGACKLTVYSNSCEVKYKAMGHYFK